MTDINKLLREIGRESKRRDYQIHNRLIPEKIYIELKKKRICDECKQTFNQPLYIHHIIAVSNGGSNELSNLQTLCWECHEKKDKEANPTRMPKTHLSWWK